MASFSFCFKSQFFLLTAQNKISSYFSSLLIHSHHSQIHLRTKQIIHVRHKEREASYKTRSHRKKKVNHFKGKSNFKWFFVKQNLLKLLIYWLLQTACRFSLDPLRRESCLVPVKSLSLAFV